MELIYLPKMGNKVFSNSAPSPMGSLLPSKTRLYLKTKGHGLGPSVRGNTILISRSNTTELVQGHVCLRARKIFHTSICQT